MPPGTLIPLTSGGGIFVTTPLGRVPVIVIVIGVPIAYVSDPALSFILENHVL
jgi:hypothetical protein